MVIIWTPASSAIRASSGALRQSSSQPVRLFSVTGSFTAPTTAWMIFSASPTSRIKAEPAWPLVTFFAGQPKLMSMIAAPRSSLSLAASAMTVGSQPANCTAIGCSSAQLVAIFIVRLFAWIIARLAIISEITSEAPYPLTNRRYGMSDTPDIGASSTLLAS